LVIINKTQVWEQNLNNNNIPVQDLMIVCDDRSCSWFLKTFPSFMKKFVFVEEVYTYIQLIINIILHNPFVQSNIWSFLVQ